ncbi:glycoside hydrolase family 3 protein [Flexithrix dorotheae]|uniref:glycoside hydrolase family 3 protein n=1 Tax=Flexithrix dorotheae TaxID=70993 RepID=UPI00037B9227|nr:glycoside hydrolase family 3 N-terminal domain-containing protein [Flexithrix dorotheae]
MNSLTNKIVFQNAVKKGFSKACTFLFFLIIFLSSCTKEKLFIQPELGVRSIELLKEDNYQFKDMNKNGKLDIYEDWRLSTDERVANLLSQMSVEEKVGFMLISTINMGSDSEDENTSPFNRNRKVTSDLYEKDDIRETNFFTRKPLPVPMMGVSGTTKGILERHLRHFILRANTKATTIADWANKVQAVAESSRLGIPVIIASNPRNHVSIDQSTGIGLGETTFTKWPGELGLAAMRDFDLTREFAETAAQEWVAAGIRKGYMYMADLATEPRWGRTEGTFGEDADLSANMIREIVLGFQGEKLGSGSVALTTKHFPGGGPQKEGQDAHFDWGKDQEYPGKMMEYHLKPFQAAIEAGTSAMMPYYAVPVNTAYDEVGFAYNKGVITDLLRGKLGYKGIVNSDTGPIFMMPWGVENLSISERYQKAIEAGVDLFSGVADPTFLLAAVQEGLVSESRIDESVTRLLKEKFELGLFENPYVDEQVASTVVGNEKFQERGNLAFRKSIVLLRNEDSLLPLKPKTKVYFEKYIVERGDTDNPHVVINPETNHWDMEFVDSPEEADLVILWLIPHTGGLFGSNGEKIFNELSKNNIDVAYVNKIKDQKPTVTVINFSNPWVINEIDNDNLNTVLATFGTTSDALLDVLSGKFNPTGKMPFSIPVSGEAVENNLADVPGYQEDDGYALFKFDEGLSYPK